MIDQQPPQPAADELDGGREQVRRHLQALRRSASLIVAIVLTATLAAVLLSHMAGSTYRATARLVLHPPDGAPTSSDVVERQLTTENELIRSPAVLRQAARRLPGTTPRQVGSQISSSVSPKANLIKITGTAAQPGQAAAIANAVAASFLSERDSAQSGDLARQRDVLEQQARQLQPAARGAVGELRALQRGLDELAVKQASAGSDLRLADSATAPGRPSAPRPLLAAVLAFFASLTIAVLVALGREQLTPRAHTLRDIRRLLGVPVLAGIPALKRWPRRRARIRRAAARDAFQSLHNAIELATPAGEQKVIVLTSATRAEGKSTVAYRLAESFVSAGQDVLLVSGDLRRPGMNTRLGVPDSPGLSEVLAGATSRPRVVSSESLARATRTVMPSNPRSCGWASLAVLPSGSPPPDPARLVTRDLVTSLFAKIGQLDYEWVLVDAPPLLGPADARIFAGAADAVLLVSRLGVATAEQLRAALDELDRLEVEPLGVAVIGAPVEVGAYYTAPRPPLRERAAGGLAAAGRLALPALRQRMRRPRAVPLDRMG